MFTEVYGLILASAFGHFFTRRRLAESVSQLKDSLKKIKTGGNVSWVIVYYSSSGIIWHCMRTNSTT